jgi:ferredoxin
MTGIYTTKREQVTVCENCGLTSSFGAVIWMKEYHGRCNGCKNLHDFDNLLVKYVGDWLEPIFRMETAHIFELLHPMSCIKCRSPLTEIMIHCPTDKITYQEVDEDYEQ